MFRVHSRDPAADSPSSSRGRHLLALLRLWRGKNQENPDDSPFCYQPAQNPDAAVTRFRPVHRRPRRRQPPLTSCPAAVKRGIKGGRHPSRLSSSVSLKLFTLSGNHAAQLSFQYRIAGAAPTPQSAACNENVYSRPAS